MSPRRTALAILLSLAGFLLLAGSASAKDRNHDRIPDRWEKRHHLSLHVNQARRDQDRDGLRNRAEFRAKLNPRDDDSDNDGIEDGDENAGTILSFQNNVLKISVFGDQVMSGTVTDATEIECEHARDVATTSSDDDPGDDDHGDDADEAGDDHGDDPGDDDQGEDEDDDDFDEDACGTDALTAGTRVVEAELKLINGVPTFTELELHP